MHGVGCKKTSVRAAARSKVSIAAVCMADGLGDEFLSGAEVDAFLRKALLRVGVRPWWELSKPKRCNGIG